MPIALYALAAGAFGIGTTEFVIMGLLLELGADLGVSISAAGQLVTGYALGVGVGAPLMTVLTAQLPRKALLLGLMVVFTAGNLACAIAPDYGTLMAARVLTSFAHGTFFGVGSVVATSLVPADKKASAVALMFTGLTLATILGVPFGTWLGQAFGWRSTFWAVAAIGVLATLTTAWLVPHIAQTRGLRVVDEIRVVLRPQVLLGLLMTAVGFAGLFTAYTYIAPMLTRLAGFTDAAVSPLLLLFGAGLLVGNLAGGRLADKALMPALIGGLAVLALMLVGLGLASHDKLAMALAVPALGAAAFATVPPLQMRVLEQARGAPTLASALNIGAFNLGNAGGAWLGGATIDHGPGLASVPWVAAVVTATGLGVALWSARLDRQRPAVATVLCSS